MATLLELVRGGLREGNTVKWSGGSLAITLNDSRTNGELVVAGAVQIPRRELGVYYRSETIFKILLFSMLVFDSNNMLVAGIAVLHHLLDDGSLDTSELPKFALLSNDGFELITPIESQ